MKQQLEDRINEGVDDTELDEQFEYYLEQSEKLSSDFKAKIAEYEIADVPDWLVVSEGNIDADALFEPIEPSQHFLSESERFGISAGTGVAAGFISAKVTSKILAKPFFKKIVAELSSKLAVRGMLAEGGTIVAPGVGTAIGVGVGIFTDYLFLKSDEAMNRESYKEEIVAAIEEQRAEMLELVQA